MYISEVNINTGFNPKEGLIPRCLLWKVSFSEHIGSEYFIDNIRSEIEELSQLLSQMQDFVDRTTIMEAKRSDTDKWLLAIKEEAKSDEPRMNRIKKVCNALKNIISGPHLENLVDKV